MKIMAEHEYFTIGSIITCTTCYQQKVQGEVLAFDLQTKMLAIKCTPASGKHSVHDVKLFNLAYVSDVQVIKEADKDTSPPPVSTLNLGKISNRLRSNIEEKKTASQLHWSRSLSRGPAVVQYNCLNNHRQSVGWSYIVVMDEVTIRPPYNLESCHGKEGSKALDHVKKIVQKFIREYGQQKAGETRKSHSPSPAATM
ncbi:protein LSM12-like [Dreissena polymorpha]|uniref:protein LSM12-like n=1 Tax=Dreissena polymorpha TaxID=45954 RepID=UPI002263DAC4|nr:protein LSM12-like [Dreissena polymorpha]